MTIAAWPSNLVPQNADLAIETKSASFESALNGARQVASLPGSKWRASISFSNLVGEDADTLRGFLAGLRGMLGQFYLPAFGKRYPNGTATGVPLVKGANQTGTVLLTDGWTPDQTAALKCGDYIQVGNLFFLVTADAASDASGNASISIAPEIRKSPADNAAIITSNPQAVMQLEDDNQTRFSQQPGKIYAISFACREVIDI